MKRRNFLASAAALSLFVSEAWAAKKTPAKPASGAKPAAPRAKAGSKPNARNVNANSARGLRGKQPVTYKPQQSVVHTADDPVIERPPQGTSASRLPPVKAAEPPSEWRTYEITTTVNLKGKSGPARFWLPLPLNQDTLYQRTLGHSWTGNPANAGMRRLPDGRVTTHYDPAIVRQFEAHPVDYEQWEAYDSIAAPVMVLHGIESDLLLPDIAVAMAQRGPRAEIVEIAGCGHAPGLNTVPQSEIVRKFIEKTSL